MYKPNSPFPKLPKNDQISQLLLDGNVNTAQTSWGVCISIHRERN